MVAGGGGTGTKHLASSHSESRTLTALPVASTDVDECVTGAATCPRFRQCVNTFGSYICKCHEGFDLMYISGKYQCHGKKSILARVSTAAHRLFQNTPTPCLCGSSVGG